MKKIGLYIHIPFCKRKCPYCDFFSIKINDEEMNRYVDKVIERFDKYCNDDIVLDTVYFGGGTPSTLGTERIAKILNTINDKFNVDENAEITMEMNPTSKELIDFTVLKECGLNRLSIGMQSAVESEIISDTYIGSDAANSSGQSVFISILYSILHIILTIVFCANIHIICRLTNIITEELRHLTPRSPCPVPRGCRP